MKKVILIACAALVLYVVLSNSSGPRFPPGVLVPYEPDQVLIDVPFRWDYKGTQVTALASFRVRARVLLTQHYWSGDEATVSPVDLTLGWRLMSNQQVLDGLDIFSQHRAFSWMARDKRLPATEREIITHSANMHMVPSTEALAERLAAVKPGDLVDIHGYLVQIKMPDGGIWRSSLSREDSGNGACELVWVNDVAKL
jgi:hypothetical protein